MSKNKPTFATKPPTGLESPEELAELASEAFEKASKIEGLTVGDTISPEEVEAATHADTKGTASQAAIHASDIGLPLDVRLARIEQAVGLRPAIYDDHVSDGKKLKAPHSVQGNMHENYPPVTTLKRNIVQLPSNVCLCDDGRMYMLLEDGRWRSLSNVPQDD